jgi:alkylated DNA repair protein (DNA oxidative demethylase)
MRVNPMETGFDGLALYPELLSEGEQLALMRALEKAFEAAPPYKPLMPGSGQPWSITQTNLGPLGWYSDRAGYRYEPHHPQTGRPWPDMPPLLMEIWDRLTGYEAPPEACLVNIYASANAKMGLHQDKDEEPLDAPVLSLSLGDTCVFRVGGFERRGPTRSFRLGSGDALVLGGASRLRFHGVDRVIAGSSRLVPGGGRINLTLRRVTRPET